MSFGTDSDSISPVQQAAGGIRLLVLISLLIGAGAQGWAGDAPPPGDYNVVVLGGDQGLPHSFVNCLAQTPDGYLWIGTHQGLARYDGIRLVHFDQITSPELKHERIERLFVDNRGALWMAPLPRGLIEFRDGEFTTFWASTGPRIFRFLGNTSQHWYFVTFEGLLLRGTPTGKRDMEWQQLRASRNVTDYAMSSSGEVLACTDGGQLLRIDGERFIVVKPGGDLAGARVNCLAADAHGQVWVGTSLGLACYTEGEVRLAETSLAPDRLAIVEMLPAREGSLWLRSENRLRRIQNGVWQADIPNWRQSIYSPLQGTVSYGDRKGGLWLREDRGADIVHVFPDGRIEHLAQQRGLPDGMATCFLEDNEDGLWIGFSYGGLARLTPRHFQVLGQAEGLTNSAILSVCMDDAGELWMTPYRGRGPVAWNNGQYQSYVTTTRDSVEAICPANGGGVWVGDSRTGISIVKQGRIGRPFESAERVGASLLHRDPLGRIWIAQRRIGVRVWDGTALKAFPKTTFPFIYRSIGSDSQGTVWLGAVQGQVHEFRGGRCRTYVAEDALGNRPVWSLLPDSNGVVWVGTFRGGLMRLKEGKFFRYTTAHGLPSDVICSILEDDSGNLWCGSYQGIFRVSKDKLHEFADGTADHLPCNRFGFSDGLPTLECSGSGACPGGWRGPDGRLWFATTRGVVSVQPGDVKINTNPPHVRIEELRVNGKAVASNLASARPAVALLGAPIERPLVVQPGRHRYEFRFTGISFDSPENVQFRYRLEGHEDEWVEGGQSRTAVYTGLDPGDYKFRVIAANRDGFWNVTGDGVLFTILPHFYQTGWFQGTVVLAVLGTVGGAVFLTVRRGMKRKLERLELRHAVEKERARIAQDMHDELGASLTKAEKLVELLGRGEAPASAPGERLVVLKETLRSMLLTMDELVWAVNPRNDSLDGLANYIAVYAREFLVPTSLRCRLEIPMETEELVLKAQQRHHLFLAFKEALTNVVRHAEASEVTIGLQLENSELVLQVTDNGTGFSGAPPGRGRRGLDNMRRRLAAVGGQCEILNSVGGGTTVRLSLSVELPASHIHRSSQAERGAV